MSPETNGGTPRLGDFILENLDAILAAWEDFARRFWQGPLPGRARLRNDAEAMLRALVRDMGTSQTLAEQKRKSEGERGGDPSGMDRAALGHALARVHDGFDIARMVAEFRALRASVSRIWWESVPTPHQEQIADMERFNEAMDQLVAASIVAFAERIDRSRRLFLGILGHDLRQPLYSIKIFTDVLAKSGQVAADVPAIAARMAKCCDAMAKMLGDLLDFTSSELGSAMPVYPAASDMEAICREVLEEVRVANPARSFNLETTGTFQGEWDPSRVRQMFSNLLSNAIHHGSPDEAIDATLRGSDGEVTLAVHNMGPAIPQDSLGILFDPMVRIAAEGKARPQGSIGLGLYICRQVAAAHGGEIKVESSAERGTTFTVRMPRRFVAGADGAGDQAGRSLMKTAPR